MSETDSPVAADVANVSVAKLFNEFAEKLLALRDELNAVPDELQHKLNVKGLDIDMLFAVFQPLHAKAT